MVRNSTSSWAIVSILAVTVLQPAVAQRVSYPPSPKVAQADEYFGVSVPDPYAWLEADVREDAQVAKWVQQQSQLADRYLKSLPLRDKIEARLKRLWDYEKFGVPIHRRGRYYFSKNDGLQNQSVIYQLDSLDAQPEVLLDPNSWSSDGTTALSGIEFSNDGKLVAYGIQEAGSDWNTWKVMEIASGLELKDEVSWIKFGDVSWSADSRGFFYSRYDEPPPGKEFQSLNKNQKVYYHRIGSHQREDLLIHEDASNPDWGFSPEVTEDGKYLVVTIWVGTDDRYRVLYAELEPHVDARPPMIELIDDFANEYSFLGNDGSTFYFKSDLRAPNKCIVAIDVADPQPENWKTILPEADQSIEDASMVGDLFIVEYLNDAKSQVKLFDVSGKFIREVELPGIGSASGFDGRRSSDTTFYSFSSFNQPPSIYRYELATGRSDIFRKAQVDFDPDDFAVQQVFYDSKDGTRVPMFIAHKKNLVRDLNTPTLLYGYGGFNISLPPSFKIGWLQWMEMGGVLAMPNLRGGGEYGQAWHKAGIKTKKQNVFDDFIAAAEWLIENRWTQPENLAIHGRSNGGLLVGACMTQRPELFGACLPAVGVMDMLKFQNWTAGRFWVDDYGSSTNSKSEFEALFAYSPYHNLNPGTEYPATLVTTSDHDDRVVPGHSFKFAARLQEVQSGQAPTLIRIETNAGHGAGKPTSMQIAEIADQWAFLVKHLGMTPDLK